MANAAEHSILVGTHTTGEQNYLMVGSVNLPLDGGEQVVKDDTTKASKLASKFYKSLEETS